MELYRQQGTQAGAYLVECVCVGDQSLFDYFEEDAGLLCS